MQRVKILAGVARWAIEIRGLCIAFYLVMGNWYTKSNHSMLHLAFGRLLDVPSLLFLRYKFL